MTKLTKTEHFSHADQTGKSAQAGFTLIELLITLVLGLLISAAALALFLDSSRNLRIQEGADDVLDPAIFTLSYLENEIAMANLGTHKPITQMTQWAGIVLTPSISEGGKFYGAWAGMSKDADLRKALSKSEASISNVKSSGGAVVNSDQLVIQYQAPFDMFDCTGRQVTKDQMVVQRFFTRTEPTASRGVNETADELAVVLACDAASFDKPKADSSDGILSNSQLASMKKDITDNIGGNGSVMMNRIDYFAFKLGVDMGNKIQYVSASEYCKKNCDSAADIPAAFRNKPIVSVKIGVIARSNSGIGSETSSNFNLLGKEVEIKNTSNNYFRRVYETTIKLGNGEVS